MNLKKAIFLDRDGTLNHDSVDYIKSLQEFDIFPFVPKALQMLQERDYLLIIITNQSGIARGFLKDWQLKQMHNYLKDQLKKQAVDLRDIYYCPHLPEENCQCRKPKTKNIMLAADKYDIDLKNSWFIGDSEKDIKTGQAAGCKTALVLTGLRNKTKDCIKNWKIKPDMVADNLEVAAHRISNLEKDK